jgi:hypothetical protein
MYRFRFSENTKLGIIIFWIMWKNIMAVGWPGFDSMTSCLRVQYANAELEHLTTSSCWFRVWRKTLRPPCLYSLKLQLDEWESGNLLLIFRVFKERVWSTPFPSCYNTGGSCSAWTGEERKWAVCAKTVPVCKQAVCAETVCLCANRLCAPRLCACVQTGCVCRDCVPVCKQAVCAV